MSVRIGNPQQVSVATTALGAGHAIVIAASNSGWALLISMMATWTATATAGGRQPLVDFRDAAGNLLWRSKAPAQVLAGQTVYLALGSRIQADAIEMRTLQSITASGLGVNDELDALRSDVDANPFPMVLPMALPEGFSIPVNATITLSDANGIDGADTMSASVIYTL